MLRRLIKNTLTALALLVVVWLAAGLWVSVIGFSG
jgi:hypothetical protein